MIDWGAFLTVFVASIVGTVRRRGLLRARHRASSPLPGRAPVVEPVEFTDAITVITPEEAARAVKKADEGRARRTR